VVLTALLQGCSHFSAAPVCAPARRCAWGAGAAVGRLKGGLGAGMPTPGACEAGDQEPEWSDQEPEELNYEMMYNVTFALPARSQRLGPLQMSWGLAETPANADDVEWREEVREAVRTRPTSAGLFDELDGFDGKKRDGAPGLDTGRGEQRPSPDGLFQRFIEGANFMNPPRSQQKGRGAGGKCDENGIFIGAKGMARALVGTRKRADKRALHERMLAREEAGRAERDASRARDAGRLPASEGGEQRDDDGGGGGGGEREVEGGRGGQEGGGRGEKADEKLEVEGPAAGGLEGDGALERLEQWHGPAHPMAQELQARDHAEQASSHLIDLIQALTYSI